MFCNTNINLGSFADVPRDLVQEIENLKKQFTVDTAKLKEITAKFEKELEKGKAPKFLRWRILF
jgi:hexokinase